MNKQEQLLQAMRTKVVGLALVQLVEAFELTNCWMKIKFHPKRPVFPGLQRCRTSLKYHPFRYQCLADSSFLHADGCLIGERMKLYLYG